MIQRIRLKNFKIFLDEELTFSKLNLLTGMNGMGKSSIIQSLLLLRQSYLKGTLPKGGLILNGDLVNIGNGRDALHVNAENDCIGTEIYFNNNHVLKLSFLSHSEKDVLQIDNSGVAFNNEVFQNALFNNCFEYLKAEHQAPDKFFSVSSFHIENLRSIGNRGEYAAHYLARYQREIIEQPEYINPKGTTKNLIDQVSAWLNEISDGIRVQAKYILELDVAKLEFLYETGKEVTSEFSPLNVGFGITYALPIVVAVLKSKPGDLLIIENPESHLHPAAQSVIAQLLARAAKTGVQVIIESHSDHIFNSIRVQIKQDYLKPEDVRVYYFERSDSDNIHSVNIKQAAIDTDGRISRQPKGFFDEFSKQLDQLLR